MHDRETGSTSRLSVVSADIDEARYVGGQLYYPHTVDVLGDRRQFSMHIDAARFGPVTLGWISYDTEVEIQTGALDDAYQVNIPLTGQLKTGSGDNRVIATPARAAVYRVDQSSMLRGWGQEPSRMLAVKIDRHAVEDHLSALLGRRVREPVRFDGVLDITCGHGQQWWSVLQALATSLRTPDSLFRHPLLASPLTQSLVVGLLLATRHDYSDLLTVDAGPACSTAVEHARQYMEAHADEELTAQSVADTVGVSLRALQNGFQKSLQTTPMKFLRDVRLSRARRDLLAADAAVVGVAEIAYRWGFTHLGRFAGQYRQMFGESPSAALRSAPYRGSDAALYYSGRF